MRSITTRFKRDEAGSTAIEYALIASSIALVIVVTVVLIGPKIRDMFQALVNALP